MMLRTILKKLQSYITIHVCSTCIDYGSTYMYIVLEKVRARILKNSKVTCTFTYMYIVLEKVRARILKNSKVTCTCIGIKCYSFVAKLFVVVQFSHLNIIVFRLLLISCWAQTIIFIVASFNISSIGCTVHRVLIHFNGCVHSLVLVDVVSFVVHSLCFSCTHTVHGILIHFHNFCNFFICMELSYSSQTSIHVIIV